MIIDKIENAKRYFNTDERLKKGLEALVELSKKEDLPVGRIEIDGEEIYANVSEYETVLLADGKWENHKNYIDIQYIVDGFEYICMQDKKGMKIEKKYSKTRDIEYLCPPKDCKVAHMTKGEFAIIFPKEAHMGKISTTPVTGNVKKIIIKVLA